MVSNLLPFFRYRPAAPYPCTYNIEVGTCIAIVEHAHGIAHSLIVRGVQFVEADSKFDRRAGRAGDHLLSVEVNKIFITEYLGHPGPSDLKSRNECSQLAGGVPADAL